MLRFSALSSLSLSLYLSLCVSLSLYLSWMLPTHCQDHILTENIWFVWSRTSYGGDKWRCYRCGTYRQTNKQGKIVLLSQWMLDGRVSQYSIHSCENPTVLTNIRKRLLLHWKFSVRSASPMHTFICKGWNSQVAYLKTHSAVWLLA